MSGRPFLQIPGPTNVPDRVLRAMDRPVIDHRGPEFAALTKGILPLLRQVFGTRDGDVVIYPASGTGAWEAALVNVLAPGDRVLAFNHGHFSAQFAQTARNLGLEVDEVPLRWGQELPSGEVEARLAAGAGTAGYRAVLVVHNETSTGVTSDVGAIRRALDAAGHDALLIVDAVSSLASIDFRFDEWRVDVALCGSQKGLMLPPGLGILCAGPRARSAAERGGSPRHFFDWRPILRDNTAGFFPYTPATLLLFGLREALRMLVVEEGLDAVYARHTHLAGGVRAAVAAWRLGILCEQPACYSNTLTAVVMPDGVDSDAVIAHAWERFGRARGVGLGRVKGRVLRIGHLGALNELEVLGTLGGVELALRECGVPLALGAGLAACQQAFVREASPVGPVRVTGNGTSPPGPLSRGERGDDGRGRAEVAPTGAAPAAVPAGVAGAAEV
jgi:alanine-glyoxylate transaminase/serine-glyoxylate transaminase/serine-pyruvate transaminase